MAFIAPKQKPRIGWYHTGFDLRQRWWAAWRFGYRRGGGSDLFEPTVDIAVVDGVVTFDDTGFLYGKPAHHQALDLCFGLFSGADVN
jgi:hypothetical protein